jgi:hypothetical protein
MRTANKERGRRLTSVALGAGIVLSVMGCARQPGDTELALTSSALAASSCAVGAPCELRMLLPKGLKAAETVMVAEEALTLADRAQALLPSPLLAPAYAGVASGGSLEVGSVGKVGGASALGTITLRSRAEVRGPLIANAVVRQDGVVAPATFTRPIGAMSKVAWKVTFPASSAGQVWMEPDTRRSISPGRYDAVRVGSRATLSLRPGAYYFESLTTEPQGRILADSTQGTVVIYVRGDLALKGSLVASPRAGDVLIGHFGTSAVFIEAELDATLVAPYAEVTMGPSAGVYDGMYFARRLNLRPDIKVQRAELSRTGPGFATVTPTFTGGGGIVAPPPPATAGRTPEQYRTAVYAYLTALYESGYDGPTVLVGAHPDDTGNQPVAATTVALDPNPVPSPAANSPEDTVVGGKPHIVEEFPRLDPAHVDPPVPVPPKTCPLGMGSGLPTPIPDPSTSPAPVDKPFHVGDPRDDSADFDAYFGVDGNTRYGITAADGFTAGVSADFGAGIRMFGVTVDFISAHADGNTATNRNPRAAGQASVELLGVPFDAWEFSTGTPAFHADLCGPLCSAPRHLLPHPIDIPIGLVTISLDAALEGQIPANLVLGDGGPNFTISPMLRAYAIVAGLVGVGVQLGVEGQLDVLRVDLPLDARFNWSFDNSPDVCKAKMEFDTGIKFRFSTLNGVLYLVGRVDVYFTTIELFRWQIMSFDGLVYEPPRQVLVDIPMEVDLPRSTCLIERAACGTPPADRTFPNLGPSGQVLFIQQRNYGQGRDQCQGQLLVDIPESSITGAAMLLFVSTTRNDAFTWDCLKEKGAATVLKTFDGTTWQTANSFEWEGNQDVPGGSSACTTTRRFDMIGPPAPFASPNQKVLVYNYEPGLKGLRFAVTATADCESLPLQLTVAQSQFPF